MMRSFDLFIALRYCFGHQRDRLSRFVAMLSGVGLVLGVAMMVTVLSVMNGFDRELREKILVVVPHIKLFTGRALEDWQAVAAQVDDHPDVVSVHPYTELEVLAKVRDQVEPMLLYAIDPDVEAKQGDFGKLLGKSALQAISTEDPGILLGYGLANRLSVVKGGDITVLMFRDGGTALEAARFRVAGVLQTGTEADQRVAILSLNSLKAIAGQSSDPRGVRVQTTELFKSHSLAYDLLDRLGFEYRASTWSMTHGNLYEAIRMSRNLVGLIVFLILAIAAFNLIATLMIASADKQSELSILKTIGAAPQNLARVFALQGLIIGVVGSGVGAILGMFLSTQMSNLTKFLEFFTGRPLLESNVYPLDYLPSDLSMTQVLFVVLVAIFLSVVAAVYPAWKVSKIDPAQVLRYE